MTSEDLPIRQTKNLRRRAVERVAEQIRTAVSRSGTDTRRLIQELEGYHIELELQLEQLRQNMAELELDYDELYESAPVGYFTLRRHGEIEETNPAGVRMLGQPRAWLVNQQFADFLTSESLLSFNEFLGRVTGGYDKESCMVTMMKGGQTPVIAYIEAVGVGPDSSCRALVVDITSGEQARMALREREAHLKLALAAAGMGVWEWEHDAGDLYWSPECGKIFGVDCVCPALETVAQLLHPEDAPRVRSMVNQALAGGQEQSVECRIIRPDGQVVWILARGQVQYDKAGKPWRMIGIAQDITERRRAGQNACPVPANKARCGANFIVASPMKLRS